MTKTRLEFLGMRFRDLKRHLLLLGASEYEISKRLDKHELVDLALEYQQQAEQEQQQVQMMVEADYYGEYGEIYYTIYQILQWVGLIIFVGFLLYLLVNFKSTIATIQHWFEEYFVNIRQKFPAMKYAFRKFLILPIILLTLSIILDFYIAHIQISVIIRWFISSNSIFLAKTISFPLQAPMMSSVGLTHGLDIGPMVTSWLCQKVKQWLEIKSAEIILKTRQKEE